VSRENVEIARRAFERFLATGPPWDMLDEEIDVHNYDTPDQGAYRGHAGYGRWLKDWGAAWADWTMEPQDYIDAGERVVVVFLNSRRQDRVPRLLQQQAAGPQSRGAGVIYGALSAVSAAPES